VEKKKKCHYSLLAAYQSHRPWKRKSGRVEKEGREKGPLKRKKNKGKAKWFSGETLEKKNPNFSRQKTS